MDPLMLARMQFGINIGFHILFPSITIALAWVLFFFKKRYSQTSDQKWMEAYFFWTKIFALSFALGVVSGVTMSFQFGTNWPGFMNTVGNIAGPLLGYEVLTAFFLEASFLAIMLFGFRRVSNTLHNTATLLVAIGTTLSAFIILILNSWMHTPDGFEMRNGVAYATDWLAIIFNPSMHYRLLHMLLASGLTVAFLISGVSAYRWLKGNRSATVQATLRTGVFLAAILAPLQIFIGDLSGLDVAKHYPQKVAAMEGLWETESSAAFRLLAIPDEIKKTNHFEIKIPYLTSLILTHSLDGEVKGINEFQHHPPMTPVFYAFRIMVALGMLMLLIAWFSAWQLKRTRTLPPWLMKSLFCMTFSGWVAVIAGWCVTEIGRQPWLVKNVLMTADAVSDVPSGMLLSSFILYTAIYVVLILAYIRTVFFLARRQQSDPRLGVLE